MSEKSKLRRLLPTTGKGLPIKTRIAIWFIALIAFVEFVVALCIGALDGFRWGDSGPFGFLFFLLFFIGPYVLSAFLLILKSKLGYVAALSILIMYFTFVNLQVARASTFPDYHVIYYSIIWNIIVIVPLTLIALDMKNYWRAAR